MSSFWRMSGNPSGLPPDSGPPSMTPVQVTSAGANVGYNANADSRDDFWEALSGHYDYLMDDQLISTCREVEADFSQHSPCPDEGMSSLGSSLPSLSLNGGTTLHSFVTPLPAFIQGGASLVGLTPQQLLCRLSELRGWLQEMDTKLEIEDDPDRKKHILKWSQHELSTYRDWKDRLLREAQIMSSSTALIGAELRAEVSRHADEVSMMWTAKETACSPPKESLDDLDRDQIFHDITADMRCLRRWLRHLEVRLPAPKAVPSYWTLHDLKAKFDNQKTIQREIESKGILVKSLLKRRDQLVLLEQRASQQQQQQQQPPQVPLPAPLPECAAQVVPESPRAGGTHHEDTNIFAATTGTSSTISRTATFRNGPVRCRRTTVTGQSCAQVPEESPASASAAAAVAAAATTAVTGPAAGVTGAASSRQPGRERSRISLDAGRLARIVNNLERRWHSLWLRSLEWLCLFEQLLGHHEQQKGGRDALDNQQDREGATSSVSSGETWDEPRTKQPRLDLALIGPQKLDRSVAASSHIRGHLRNSPRTPTGASSVSYHPASNVLERVPNKMEVATAEVPPRQSEPNLIKHKKPQQPTKEMVLASNGIEAPVPGDGNNSAQTKLNQRPPSGNYEGGQDVGYSSESSTQLSVEDKPELHLMHIYTFPQVTGSADTTPESPEMPSRDSGLSGGGSPRKCFPTSAKCSPINDLDHDENHRMMKDVLHPDYVVSPAMRPPVSASNLYRLTTAVDDSDVENATGQDDQSLLDKTLTPKKDSTVTTESSQDNPAYHTVEIDHQVVHLRRKPPVSRHFAPLELDYVAPAMASSCAGGVVVPDAVGPICANNTKANRVQEWLQSCEVSAAKQKIPEEVVGDHRDQQQQQQQQQQLKPIHQEQQQQQQQQQQPNHDDDMTDLKELVCCPIRARQKSSTTLNADSLETLVTIGGGAGSTSGVVAAPATATPTADLSETPSRVVNLRSGKKRRSRDRPWSVTEMPPTVGAASSHQLPTHMSRSFTLASSSGPMTSSITSITGRADSPVGERRRHNRTSKAKAAAAVVVVGGVSNTPSSSGSDSEASDAAGVAGAARRHSSTTSLINLCEPAKEKTSTPVRRRRLGSKVALSKTNLTTSRSTLGYSSSKDNATQEVQSDADKKSDVECAAVGADSVEATAGDQGSVLLSDNMWDDYQDPLYNSESYSEKEMDDDTMRRVLNFGDDYQSFIGSMSDTSSLSGLRVRGSRRRTAGRLVDCHGPERSLRDSELDSEQEQPPNSHSGTKSNDNTLGSGNSTNAKMDVDGDVTDRVQVVPDASSNAVDGGRAATGTAVEAEDASSSAAQADSMISRSSQAFASVSNALKKYLQSNDAMTTEQFNELIATCRSNIKCLQIIKICISIGSEQPGNNRTAPQHPQAVKGGADESNSGGPTRGPANLGSTVAQLLQQHLEHWQRLMADIVTRGATTLNEASRHVNVATSVSCAAAVPGPRNVAGDSVRQAAAAASDSASSSLARGPDEAAREEILKLREKMLHVESMQMELDGERVEFSRDLDAEKLDQRIALLKRTASSLHELKSSLFAVKVKVHRLTATHSDERLLSLKRDVQDLYSTWDTLYRRNGLQLTELQQSQKVLLQQKEQKVNASPSATVANCANASPQQPRLGNAGSNRAQPKLSAYQSGFDISQILKISAKLKGAASIGDLPLKSLRSGIYAGTTSTCAGMPFGLETTTAADTDDDYDSTYESEEELPTIVDTGCTGHDGEGRYIWRIFKAALPFQVALVMLYCVAYLMEPRCCNLANTLNSFGPQLRYEQGPPPV